LKGERSEGRYRMRDIEKRGRYSERREKREVERERERQ
jgi:hypothetical protein